MKEDCFQILKVTIISYLLCIHNKLSGERIKSIIWPSTDEIIRWMLVNNIYPDITKKLSYPFFCNIRTYEVNIRDVKRQIAPVFCCQC